MVSALQSHAMAIVAICYEYHTSEGIVTLTQLLIAAGAEILSPDARASQKRTLKRRRLTSDQGGGFLSFRAEACYRFPPSNARRRHEKIVCHSICRVRINCRCPGPEFRRCADQ